MPSIDFELIRAISDRDEAAAIELVKRGASVSRLHGTRVGIISALHAAAAMRMLKLMELCLRRGADPNHRAGSSRTPMYFATCSGDLSVVRLLLRYGAHVNAVSVSTLGPVPETPLSVAASLGISMHINPKFVPSCSFLPMVEFLLDRGASPDLGTVGGATILNALLTAPNQERMIRLMLEHGALCDAVATGLAAVNYPEFGRWVAEVQTRPLRRPAAVEKLLRHLTHALYRPGARGYLRARAEFMELQAGRARMSGSE